VEGIVVCFDGVPLRAKGQKLTPTERKLTPAQQQEFFDLVRSGVLLRKVARQFGISRSALDRLLEGQEE